MKARYTLILPIFLPALVLGCFSYVPADVEAVPVGTRVRAHLTAAGTDALRVRTGLARENVAGTLVEKRETSLVFLMRSVSSAQSDASLDDLYQQIDVPRRDVVLVEHKKLQRERTALMIAGGIVGAGAVLYYSLRGEPGTYHPGPQPGPVDHIRVPFLMLRLFLPH